MARSRPKYIRSPATRAKIPLTAFEARWQYRFDQLLAFKERTGHCDVPARWPRNPQLAQWVLTQRVEYRRGILYPQRQWRLERIGFTFSFFEAARYDWEACFAKLQAFQGRHGHCDVPKGYAKGPALAAWLQQQRKSHHAGSLDPKRARRLERLGVTWHPVDAAWRRKMRDLERFLARFGHCRVPQGWSENVPLGRWVNKQRRQHRAGRLPPERVRELEALGFEWELQEALWKERFEAWRTHVRKTGSAHIPQRLPDNPSLARWVTQQRLAYHKGELAPSRVLHLTRAGFLWRVHDARWEERFAELRAFHWRHGHARVPQRCNPTLGHWLNWQLQSWRRGALRAERKRKLAELGIRNPVRHRSRSRKG